MKAVFLLLVLGACAAPKGPRVGAFGREPAPAMAYGDYIRGRSLAYAGDHAQALVYFRRAAALTPDDPGLRVAIAEELYADGQLEGAQGEVASILSRWPDTSGAWILRGRLAARQGDLENAARAYEEAVRLAPDLALGYRLAGTARVRLKQRDQARTIYASYVARFPEDQDSHFRLGRVLFDDEAWALAISHLERATLLAPDRVETYVWLFRAYLRSGKTELAVKVLRDALDHAAGDPSVGGELFRALLASGDRKAAFDFLASLEKVFREPEARVALGYLYLEVRVPDPALALSAELLAGTTPPDSARLLEARAFMQKHENAKAMQAAGRVLPESRDYAEARALVAELHVKEGRFAEAHAVLDEALARAPGDVALARALASVWERAGDVAKARGVLETAQKANPEDRDLIFARASLEERSGQADRAVAIMRTEVLENEPDSLMALNFIGYSYANRRVHLAEAEKYLARAVDLAPDDGFVLDSWGWLLVQSGRLREGVATLELANTLAPEEPEILLHLGEAHLRQGNRVRAKTLFGQALALEPDEPIKQALERSMQALSTGAASG